MELRARHDGFAAWMTIKFALGIAIMSKAALKG
jgi:hypothetical protein